MAHVFPQQLPAGTPASERIVFDAMRGLPEAWTVLWDVPVGLFGRPRADRRQIDFLLIHPEAGLIVLEVKGGSIKVEHGEWFTQPRGSSDWKRLSRSPFKQVADQRFTLERWLRARFDIDRRFLCHGVVFPGCDAPPNDLGPDAPTNLAIGQADLAKLEPSLWRIRSLWGDCPRLEAQTLREIVASLRPSFEMRILAATTAAATVAELDRETRRRVDMVHGQVDAYRTLLRTQRLVVLGGAGTGKTVVAAELASHHASLRHRTLLLCHRASVRAFLTTLLDVPISDRWSVNGPSKATLQVAAWSNLVAAVHGLHEGNNSPSDLSERFLSFRESLDRPYDVVVVDEGQEFTPDQLEALTWILDDPASSPLYVFADPFQHSGLLSTPLRDRFEKRITFQWTNPIDGQQIFLTENCRNTKQIAELAGHFYPEPAPAPLVEGRGPLFHRSPRESVLKTTFDLVGRLIQREGFETQQILVVVIGFAVSEAEKAGAMAGVGTIAGDRLARFPLTPRDVRVVVGRPDEVQGLEADVTIVALGDGSDHQGTPRELYVGISRAKAEVHVVSPWARKQVMRLASKGAEAADQAIED